MKLLIAAACFFFLSFSVFAQESETPADEVEHEPLPYRKEEFTDWLNELRRAEIIALGALPITSLYCYLLYGMIRFAYHGFAVEYSFLGSANRIPFSTDENVGVLVAACSTAVLIAVADLILGNISRGAVREMENAEAP